jgi:Na+-transporting NADH:ubiquinone oxidoreductase subunit NqrC
MIFKMDSSPSRLRTKSNDEAEKDAAEQEKLQSSAQESEVIVRVMTTDGKIQDVVLPVSSFKEISSISLLSN